MRIVLAVCLLVLIDAKNVCRYPKKWKTYVNLKEKLISNLFIFFVHLVNMILIIKNGHKNGRQQMQKQIIIN